MAASDYLENLIYNAVLRGTNLNSPAALYVSLWSTDPADDASGTELAVANGYIRQVITFGAPSNGTGSNDNLVTFTNTGSAWTEATHFAISDALAGGNLLYHGLLRDPKTVGASETYEFAIGDLIIQHS